MVSVSQATVIDACVFHEWPGTQALAPYLTDGWREILMRPGDLSGPVRGLSHWLYQDPDGPKLLSAYPAKGPAGSDRSLLTAQVGARRLVLGYDDGLLATAFVHHHIAHTLTCAANDWTIKEWLEADDRLYGLVLVANVMPERAAEEIRRSGAHPKMVGIAMGANGLHRPFGHPIYQPIYAAAVEMGLPIVLQASSELAADAPIPPVSGGLPATFGEYRTMSMHGHMTHLASLIVQGVFEQFPTLQVLLVGGGAAWIPGYLWRLDSLYKTGSGEAPWLTRMPSEYFTEHCRVSTYSLEAPPNPADLAGVLETVEDFDRVLIYASCYPSSDSETPEQVAARIPAAWRDQVFERNAEEFFSLAMTSQLSMPTHRGESVPAYNGPIVDVDIHHKPKSDAELAQYLPKQWRDYVTGNGIVTIPLKPAQAATAGTLSDGARRRDSYPADGSVPGSDYETLRDQLLDPYNYYKGLLTYDLGEYACQTNPYLAVELCRAANEWNIEQWLSRDSRLVSAAIVPSADPALAAAELRRVGTHDQIVGVLMSGNPVGRPFGDPHFHPIYEVAAELGLVVSIHLSGGDRPNSTGAVGGIKGTAIEHITQLNQAGMHHLSSMVVHGAFEKYPSLKVMLTEYGLGWIPAFLWRLDREYDLLRRESPWVKRLPSETIRTHVKFTTQPFEESPNRKGLIQVLERVEGIEEMLCFTTDYPHITMDDPMYIARRIPSSWQKKVFLENACAAYGWEVPVVETVASAA